jgi:hypothetical protein
MTRREMLKRAAQWAAFMTVAKRGDAQIMTSDTPLRGTARACVFFYLNGAPSHVDTFDVKDGPWNPRDANIQQYHGGIALSTTMFPRLSQMTGDLCILRSVRSWEAAHDRGVFYAQTSHPSNPAFIVETPHMGAIAASEKATDGPMPPFLLLDAGGPATQGSAFLGGRFSPMKASGNQSIVQTMEHNYFGTHSPRRFEERFAMLRDLDASLLASTIDRSVTNHGAYYDSAKRLMYDPAIASVFQLNSKGSGSNYGDSLLGKSTNIASNAIRANNGAVFVALSHGGWDTHQNMFDRAYTPNMYTITRDLDSAVAGLVEDLKASGDLDKTLIVIMGEFGRTPGPLNAQGGRDHHRDAMSVVMIGGGVAGGRVIGATDAIGEYVTDPGWSAQRPIVMEDIASTIYSALGIDWTKSLLDTPSGRRFEYVPSASRGAYKPVDEVFR